MSTRGIFREILENIPGNVWEDSEEYYWTKIPGNVRENSGKCSRRFRRIQVSVSVFSWNVVCFYEILVLLCYETMKKQLLGKSYKKYFRLYYVIGSFI